MKIGDKFCKMTVIELNNEDKTALCECECGNTKTYKQSTLRERKDRKQLFMCDECKEQYNKKHAKKIGERYYKLLVTEYVGNGYYRCKCDCGNFCIVKNSKLCKNDRRRCIKSCGCDVINYTKDEKYFEQIDSEAKAYMLGFIAADGCVHKGVLKITLKEDDKDILEKFAKEIKYDGAIKIKEVKTKLPQGTDCISSTCEIQICSKKICEDLAKYGIVERKTKDLQINFDLIPQKHTRDFLRGFFDGDGTCNITRTTRICYKITIGGSEFMTRYIKNLFAEIYPQLTPLLRKTGKHFYMLSYSSKEAYTLLSDYMYKDCTFYLNRKYKRYLKNLKNLELINSVQNLNCKEKSLFYEKIDFENGKIKS